MAQVYNENPVVFTASGSSIDSRLKSLRWLDDNTYDNEDEGGADVEPIDRDEIFDLIRNITDPEHPCSLEDLRVVSAPQVSVNRNTVVVEFTPTVPHCGMSTLIGLSIRVRLMRSLPARYKIDIFLKPGSHNSEQSVNRQLNDKERVAAALENQSLLASLETVLADVRPT
ncbi:hypothetical protein BDV98DRAFT_558480 [Pterulicium gracile]|uniref:MIP18 family-like domain-containing protein n=1 Tax=Pterulicium gracile TaxID=1884261 RepID=A0A5C3R3J5_9AGAR|nr:hypothetical protein BDV98DRAFT_558480 [Pterula gracilis]